MSGSEDIRPTRLNKVESGREGGDVVVLLHAVGLDLTYWDRQIEALADSYRVVAIDLPGHGLSSVSRQGCGISRLAEDVARVIDDTEAGATHVVGHSFGGMIAQELALSFPGSVRSLTLIATAATFTDERRAFMRSHAASVREDGMGTVVPMLPGWVASTTAQRRPDLIDRLTKSIRAMNPAVYASAWEQIAAFDTVDRLAALTSPTLVLAGDQDTNTPVADADILAGGIRGAEVVVLPGAAHMVPLDAAAHLNSELLAFLATV
jgi:3-oxoadipate enol-lactonase